MALRTRLATMTVAAFAAVAVPLAAGAQESAPLERPFSEEKIEAFVGAALDVVQLRDSYSQRIQQAESDAERERLVQEGNAEIRSAVESAEGISLAEYSQIGRAASEDEELNARIVARIEEQMPQ
jgi:hypothetical protein